MTDQIAGPRQPAYDAVFAYIRSQPRDFLPTTVVARNAMIWHAVHAALDAIPSPACPEPIECAHEAALGQAQAELARLRAGEEDGWNPAVIPTPGQWIERWNRASPETRLHVAERVIADADTASRCFLMDHEKRLVQEKHAWVALARVRDVIADMEQITGARHWARILRKVVDGDEPAPAPDTAATCAEHDGPCFPDPTTKCPAHGEHQCALCHRNPSNCTTDYGACGFWSATGMHWDTCPNRIRGPLAPGTAATQATDPSPPIATHSCGQEPHTMDCVTAVAPAHTPKPIDTAHRYCILCGNQVQPGHTCDPAGLRRVYGSLVDRAERQHQRADAAEEAERRMLDQRQEMAEERYIWQQRGDRAEATLREVLAMLCPTRNDHGTIVGYQPPYPITPAEFNRWNAVLNAPKEQ